MSFQLTYSPKTKSDLTVEVRFGFGSEMPAIMHVIGCTYPDRELLAYAFGSLVVSHLLHYPEVVKEFEQHLKYKDPALFTWWDVLKSYRMAMLKLDGMASGHKMFSPLLYGSEAFNYESFNANPVKYSGDSVALLYAGGKESVLIHRMLQEMGARTTLSYVSRFYGDGLGIHDQWKQQSNSDPRIPLGTELRKFMAWDFGSVVKNLRYPASSTARRAMIDSYLVTKRYPTYSPLIHSFIFADRLCAIARYHDVVDYIATGDEIECNDVVTLDEKPLLHTFGVDFAQSQLGNNLLNSLFLQGRRAKLISPVMNLCEMQTQAIAISLGLQHFSCWESNSKWCNACWKCMRIATLYEYFDTPLPAGLSPAPDFYKRELNKVSYLNQTDGEKKQFSYINSIMDSQIGAIKNPSKRFNLLHPLEVPWQAPFVHHEQVLDFYREVLCSQPRVRNKLARS